MDMISIKERLDISFIDVVTTYLYKNLDNDIYMKVLDGLKIPHMGANQSHNMY